MDINQILPFLLKGDDSDQKSKLLASMMAGGGSKEDILASMAGGMGGGNAADILSQMKGGGSNAEMMAIMNMLKMKQKKTSDKVEGLKIISDFAPPDILGTMYKMLE